MPADRSSEPTLQELLDAVDRLASSGFHEADLRFGGVRLRVSRGPSASARPVEGPAPVAPAVVPVAPPPSRSADVSSDSDDDCVTVSSPMVGMFYRRPRPDADAFVEVGDRVRKGQVLCIIEAMKLMNNIEAEATGEIVEILPEDASPVQFGDPLFLVRPS